MKNITQYTDGELSMLVYNTENLYSMRLNSIELMETIDDTYIYTNEQLNILIADLNSEEF